MAAQHGLPGGGAADASVPPTTASPPTGSDSANSAAATTTARPLLRTQPTSTTAVTAAAAEPDMEAPEQAGERLASHLDMLAETVRAIVTHVMQPGSGAAQGCECCAAGDCTLDQHQTSPNQEGQELVEEVVTQTTPTSTGRAEYSLETRELCVAKHAAGASYKAIATELGMPATTVQTIVKRARQQGGVVTVAQRAGRPRVTNESVERTIREMVALHPEWSAREVLEAVMAAHEGIAVSFETIRRRVRDCRRQLNEPETAVAVAATQAKASTAAPMVNVQLQDGGLDDDSHDVEMDTYASSEEADLDQDADPELGVMDAGTDVETSAGATDEASPLGPSAAAGKTRRKRGSEYSPEFRETCVQMHERDGKSYQAIALELSIPPDSVRAIVRKAKRTGSVVTAPRSGRPRKTTDLIDRVILQSVKNSQRSTAKQIQDDLWTIYQVKVSCETIRRRVRDHTKLRLQTADSAPQPTGFQSAAAPPIAMAMAMSAPAALATTLQRSGVMRRTVRAMAPLHQMSSSPSVATPGSTTTEDDGANALATATARSLKRKRSEYPLDVREKCVALHGQGLGYRKIGEQLSMPHTTVRAIVEKVQRTGSMLPAPRSGRPRKTDEILDKVILQTVKTNDKCSARMIQEELETAFDVKVSCETIRRRVKDYMRQKHLFAENAAVSASSPSSTSTAAASSQPNERTEIVTEGDGHDRHAVSARRIQQDALRLSPTLSELEIQQQQQHQESMLLMAEITQPFGMVSASPDVRNVPQSLMEMMAAAAAAAAAVSTQQHQQHHQHQELHHQSLHPSVHQLHQQQQHQHNQQQLHFQQQQQSLALMPAPFGYAFAHQPHSQAMQAMLDEALATTQPLGAGQPPQPPSPPPMSEFVL